MDNHTIPPTLPPPPPAADSPDFPDWLIQRMGQLLVRERLAQGLSGLGLSNLGGSLLSDQTISNNEKGKKNAGLATYARHGQMLNLNILDLLAELLEEYRRWH
ncbi:MAG: hypothetical protein JNJ83_02725 [Verrucomicrobiaceae bacterium]|nr:hypothetical protein [Verrucomicrobiaceae bacterium]